MKLSVEFLIFIIVALIVSYGSAAESIGSAADEAKEYQKSYAICSPVVHQIVRQECHYGSLFEKHYQNCMTSQGFGEELELDPSFYNSYLENYRYCNNLAQRLAEKSCNYGQRYQKHYSQCMLKYGFDGKGEYIGAHKPAPGSLDKDAPSEQEEYFEYDS